MVSAAERKANVQAVKAYNIRRNVNAEEPHYGTTPQVQVIVGPAGATTTYALPDILLRSHSTHFANQVAGVRVVALQADPILFRVFVEYVCRGVIRTKTNTGQEPDDESQEYDTLGRCWTLGDTLGSISFKDAVIDAVIHKLALAPVDDVKLDLIIFAYYKMAAGDNRFKNLAIGWVVYHWEDPEFHKKLATINPLPNKFLQDITFAQRRYMGVRDKPCHPAEDEPCKYHEHGGAVPCHKKALE